ncbi:hypothetical protein [Aureibacillus halotolerans]|uniref:Uncharacterized protein n=1 Tax=Aureibacillus halotolerans TaxID=1508390 RepID=A0A4R6UAI1_9BACI|nr:hypothetical protein [Aureibacillus halotolerans]TDQ42053.1 hypothetical protein EV213_10281 [Aureibacillus halotolerans]
MKRMYIERILASIALIVTGSLLLFFSSVILFPWPLLVLSIFSAFACIGLFRYKNGLLSVVFALCGFLSFTRWLQLLFETTMLYVIDWMLCLIALGFFFCLMFISRTHMVLFRTFLFVGGLLLLFSFHAIMPFVIWGVVGTVIGFTLFFLS